MNDKEQNFQTGPYKATKNLNTIIGNPDININSVVTSNIMESPTENTVNNNIIEPQNLNNNLNNNDTVIKNDNKIPESVENINTINNNQYENPNQQIINNTFPINDTENKNIQQKTEPQKVSSVTYENVYQSKKTPKKKSFKIPNEFKTTIVVVLILLIFISFFEKIYDFLRNLNIFG